MTGLITITNKGAYVARFSVSYDFKGERITHNSGNFTAGVARTLQIQDGATNVVLIAEDEWFIASWRTIFTENFSGPVSKCYVVGGTTLNPNHKSVPCN